MERCTCNNFQRTDNYMRKRYFFVSFLNKLFIENFTLMLNILKKKLHKNLEIMRKYQILNTIALHTCISYNFMI